MRRRHRCPTSSARLITTFQAESGEIIERGRLTDAVDTYYASPVAGDGKVYMASERGVVTILKAGREWEVLGSHDLGERVMATPVIHEGRIYIRTDNALYSVSGAPEP